MACVWGGLCFEFVANCSGQLSGDSQVFAADQRPQEMGDGNRDHATEAALTILRYRGIGQSTEALRACLQGMQPDHPDQLDRVVQARQWVKELGSTDYSTRRRAVVALEKATWLPLDELAKAQESDDFELRSAAQMIIRQSQERAPRDSQAGITEAICHLIVARQIKGLCPEVAQAMLLFDEPETIQAIQAAIVVTASPKDIGLLEQLVNSPAASLRISALQAILALEFSDSTDLLNRSLSDPDPSIKLFAAKHLADLGDRRSIPCLLELMTSQDFEVRRDSHRILHATTKKDFEYLAFGKPEERRAALTSWQHWWSEFGATAKLEFPLAEIQRGNGKILLSNFREKLVIELNMNGEVTWQKKFDAPWALRGLPNGHRLVSQLYDHSIVEFDKRGREIWRLNDLPGRIASIDRDSDGNLLVACPDLFKVYEYDRVGKLIWEMNTDGMTVQVNYLKNGNRLVAFVRPGKVMEIDRNGKMVSEITGHGEPLSARRTSRGTTLVTYSGNADFNEFDQSGELLRKIKGGAGNLIAAEQVSNGDFIIASNQRVSRINQDGQVIWQYEPGFHFQKISIY